MHSGQSTGGRAAVRFEQLENRQHFAVNPLYVLVHGAALSGSGGSGWAEDTAVAINERMGLGASEQQVRNSVVRYNQAFPFPPANSSPNFVIFDWSAVSGLLYPGNADSPEVAGALANVVMARVDSSPGRDVHFIGHSRGAYVINAAIEFIPEAFRFNKIGFLQQTTLDFQAFGNDGAIDVPRGVDLADNYFQTTGQLHGGPVAGAFNLDLTERLNRFSGRVPNHVGAHSEVRDWYHWTIDNTDHTQAEIDADRQRYIRDTTRLGDTPAEVCRNRRILYAGLDPTQAIGFGQREGKLPRTCGTSVVTVIDRSGSMNDYGKMAAARNAADLFVNFFETGDHIGVVSFSEFATTDFSLTEISNTSNAKAGASNAIRSLLAGGSTAIGRGLQAAANQLASHSDEGDHQVIVLLSDGQEVENSDPLGVARSLPEEIDVYTIALGLDADQALLRQIASVTGGKFLFSPSAGELQKLYTEIVLPITGGTELLNRSTTINPGGTVQSPVRVPNAGSVTFGVNYGGSDLDLELTTPSGSRITRWNLQGAELVEGATFEFIRLSNATPGTYTLNVVGVDVPTFGYPLQMYAFARAAAPRDAVGQNGAANDLKFDRNGVLHFAWYDTVARTMKYASQTTDGAWSDVQIIDDTVDNAGVYLSLAVGPDNRPAVAYFDGTNGDLRYAAFDGAQWNVQTIDSNRSVGLYPSLQFNRFGQPAIAYYKRSTGDLKLAEFNGTSWATRVLDAAGDAGRHASMVRKGDGYLAVAYANSTTGHLRHIEEGKSGWRKPNTIDDSLTGGVSYISLATDPNGAERVSYYDAGPADLKFAQRTSPKKNNWKIFKVASKGTVGLHSKLLFSARGVAYILYYERNSNTLRMAFGRDGAFSTQIIGDNGGRLVSVADSPVTRTFSLAYADSDSGDLLVRQLR